MGRISVVINTLNEEENLPRALKSVDWADEVVVVDMHSDDDTVKIAKKAGARVYSHEKTGYVEPARNYAISKAKGGWILVLDADEEVSADLRHELKRIASSEESDYYAVPRKNIIFGKWIKNSNWWPDYNIRFFKKGSVEWDEAIHSVPLTQGKGADIDATEKLAIVHHNYTSVEQYINRLNRYTTVQAKARKKKGEKPDWRKLISKPTSEFISRYFAAEGYKDGIHGLALSGLQAFSELVVEVKLWELSKFPERSISPEEVSSEIGSAQRDLNYWVADMNVKEKGGLVNQIKRKFKLP